MWGVGLRIVRISLGGNGFSFETAQSHSPETLLSRPWLLSTDRGSWRLCGGVDLRIVSIPQTVLALDRFLFVL